MNKNDSLGDRMKRHESRWTQPRLMEGVPILARLDGRSFSNLTKNLEKPYSKKFIEVMFCSAFCMVEDFNATNGYVQSDEITLYWPDVKSISMFDGKLSKLLSCMAAHLSVGFHQVLSDFIPELSNSHPSFDCRVWEVPNNWEAANCLLWREQDAVRNSIQGAARSVYSHNECYGKNSSQLQEMLFQKGINWNDYPPHFKRGTHIARRRVARCFTFDEIEKLPEGHAAKEDPAMIFERTDTSILKIPILSKIQNLPGVLFEGEVPVLRSKEINNEVH